ncbi:DUF1617 family protein [Salinibacillus xinjiangensis]|uniref:DUF1617 family protein n=1 Tax=Salinibacillus xinjiangensis TaxID=1229268 RepID=A0A6G1X7U7_9BACI|nr:DUF1617 family protein [Salinibacillus xinjiangensis]MRG87012.1 DUF1617 family protein [Salinibacillus xinjiangensis]
MQVKIENGQLAQVSNLLFNLSLKGKQSRHRTKFIKLLNERVKEVEEQRIELAKEHSKVDEGGEPIINGNQFELKDVEEFQKELKELFDEEMVIEGGDYQGMLKTVQKVLEECDKEFSGQEAFTYDYICEQFENAE